MSKHDCFKQVSLINLVHLLTIFLIRSQKYLKVKSKLAVHESNCKLYTSPYHIIILWNVCSPVPTMLI